MIKLSNGILLSNKKKNSRDEPKIYINKCKKLILKNAMHVELYNFDI